MKDYNFDNFVDKKDEKNIDNTNNKRKKRKKPSYSNSEKSDNTRVVLSKNKGKYKRKNTSNKRGFSNKFFQIGTLVFVFALILFIMAIINTCSNKNAAPAPSSPISNSSSDQANKLDLIIITVKGEDIYYNGNKLESIDNLKLKLEKDVSSNTALSYIDDLADETLFQNIKILGDSIKNKSKGIQQ